MTDSLFLRSTDLGLDRCNKGAVRYEEPLSSFLDWLFSYVTYSFPKFLVPLSCYNSFLLLAPDAPALKILTW
ncbi:hypothetical protein N657DRAFT_98918 [Parathielavia appendiculata]|uniref:Uncharacterized protein n=1 Tax=Parathielavia appendiculata TaxID=2587402 RepID=A0AAN6Z1F3_9PEZI|nr:hypothetical protein N657DRAFT_98918 [Parathielavia appendiculata]